ncbi:MAG: tetratricopeptide repeat protein, partial [Pseudomonadota bacterium]
MTIAQVFKNITKSWLDNCLDDGLKNADRLIDMIQGDPAGYVWKGLFLYQFGRPFIAFETFKKSATLDPNDVFSFFMLALIAFENGNHEAAFKMLNATAIDENHDDETLSTQKFFANPIFAQRIETSIIKFFKSVAQNNQIESTLFHVLINLGLFKIAYEIALPIFNQQGFSSSEEILISLSKYYLNQGEVD